ncbi:replication protein [Modicisalibacter tunisiensis]|uniref:replication protein n=1 Tax=Modicisalibacter tunisiensis TaxID=390637 RepID=UPI001CCDF70D|nr:replication protein [Modicisalibacter tunisiensis]MBZ9540490.1 replication protein [Modicisalibacter tunisiensis]
MSAPAAHDPRQLSLITEPSFYHDVSESSYLALLARQLDGGLRQKTFRTSQLDKVIQAAPRDRDCYLSQAQFMRPNRRAVNLYSLPLLFCDLDPTTKRHLPPEEWRRAVLMACNDQGLPAPSLIVYSGRGVHLKWILDKPLPRAALPRWNLAQRLLGEHFADLGADPQARDASRVLRLEHTVNTKTGERCEVVWVTDGGDGLPIRYPFDVLFDEVAPLARGQLEELRESRAAEKATKPPRWGDGPSLTLIKGGRYGLKRINYQELAWHRLEDLRSLAVMRAEGSASGEALAGERMRFLFWSLNFMALSHAVTPSSFWREAQSLAATLAPGWRYDSGELSTLYHKTMAYFRGEVVEFEGRKVPPLYTPRNATLVERFAITDEEQRRLKTIVSKDEARRRHAERERQRRRQAGAMDREAYQATAQHRRDVARALRAEGATNAEIAQRLGVHVKTVPRLIREG